MPATADPAQRSQTPPVLREIPDTAADKTPERRSGQDRRGGDDAGGEGWRGHVCMLSTHGYVAAVPKLGQPDTGGQIVYVLEVSKALHQLGYKVDVVTRGFAGQPEVEEMDPGLRVLRVPFGGDDFIVKEDFHDIVDEGIENFLKKIDADRLKYDLISSHYWDAGVIGQAVADELGVPHVHTPHSIGAWKREQMDEKSMPPEKFATYRFDERIEAEKRVYDKCAHLIAHDAPAGGPFHSLL